MSGWPTPWSFLPAWWTVITGLQGVQLSWGCPSNRSCSYVIHMMIRRSVLWITKKGNFLVKCFWTQIAYYVHLPLLIHVLVWCLHFSLSTSFQQSYIEGGGTFYSYCNKAFASWDYCTMDENAAKIKHQSIVQDINVSLWSIYLNCYSPFWIFGSWIF